MQPLDVKFGHWQEIALGRKRATGDQGVDVRMPMQKLPVGLDCSDHARQYVRAAERAADFRPDAGPGAGAEPAQQLAIEAGVQPQAFGDGQDHLPVRNGRTDRFGHVQGGQQGDFRPLCRFFAREQVRIEQVTVEQNAPGRGSRLGGFGYRTNNS